MKRHRFLPDLPHQVHGTSRGRAAIGVVGVVRVVGLAAAACLGWVGLAHGADFYVNNSSSACSDAGPGSQSNPYCTISAALAAHHDPGTNIYVMPGIYREQVTVPA